MADAKKCDACGEFYVIEGISQDIVATYNDPTVPIKINTRRYDTCPECMRAFFNFIESRQKVAVKGICKDCKHEDVAGDDYPCMYCGNGIMVNHFEPKEENKDEN